MSHARILCLIAVLLTASACERRSGHDEALNAGRDSTVLNERESRLEKSLALPDSGNGEDKPIARWLLPPELSEISGLALTDDDRLFAHNDESARISEIDYRRGTILKHFYAGEKELRGDFESITFGDNRFFLMTSNGMIYEFPEGQQGERVDCTVFDTHLGKQCEFEGMVYDPRTHGLVLSCKNVGRKKDRDQLVLYHYAPGDDGSISEVTVPQQDVIGKNPWKQVRPTDITIDPESGNFVLVAAQEKALIELTPDLHVVFARPLASGHPQAEGVAITRDHILIISDESTAGPATITLYRWP
jgi:uncharacterized protein YjiK